MNYRLSGLAIAALGLILIPAASAQQQDDVSTVSPKTLSSSSATPASIPPDPAKGSGSSIGIDFPRVEVFGGASFVQFHPVPGLTGNLYGGHASVAYNVNRWFGIVADGSVTHLENAGGFPVDDNLWTYQFGPRFTFRNGSRFTTFAQVLFGGAHSGMDLNSNGVPESGFSMAAGGGVDVSLWKHLSYRVVQVDYLMTTFASPGASNPQNNLRVSSGIVLKWGSH